MPSDSVIKVRLGQPSDDHAGTYVVLRAPILVVIILAANRADVPALIERMDIVHQTFFFGHLNAVDLDSVHDLVQLRIIRLKHIQMPVSARPWMVPLIYHARKPLERPIILRRIVVPHFVGIQEEVRAVNIHMAELVIPRRFRTHEGKEFPRFGFFLCEALQVTPLAAQGRIEGIVEQIAVLSDTQKIQSGSVSGIVIGIRRCPNAVGKAGVTVQISKKHLKRAVGRDSLVCMVDYLCAQNRALFNTQPQNAELLRRINSGNAQVEVADAVVSRLQIAGKLQPRRILAGNIHRADAPPFWRVQPNLETNMQRSVFFCEIVHSA